MGIEQVMFRSGEVRCAGDLYLPDKCSKPAPVPGVVMGHSVHIVITATIAHLDANQPIAWAVDDRSDPTLLDAVRARGQHVAPRAADDPTLPRGYWGAIAHDPARTPRYHGARTFGWGPIRGLPS